MTDDNMAMRVAGKFTQEHITAREGALNAAVSSGRIPPDRRNHWSAQYDADPRGTAATLARLAPVLRADPNAAVLASLPAYNERWLTPPERARLENVRVGGRHPTIMIQEG